MTIQDLGLYIDINYIDESYFVIMAEADAELTSIVTFNVDATKTVFVNDNISAQSYLYGPTSSVNAIGTIILAVPNPSTYRTRAVIVGDLNVQ